MRTWECAYASAGILVAGARTATRDASSEQSITRSLGGLWVASYSRALHSSQDCGGALRSATNFNLINDL